ncbi:TPA: TcpE family conjugal transfer membrane protein [Staphylococcus aureus]|uniref:TcpE family conjugal transfer membrane protein n=1 Tax=Staphylococcus TaxID=1279 RepID=UPI000D1D34B9|nr:MULTISPECIES: TcpE family conjugal transfer membrane protein [Staphylococcus]PTI19842.1 conjugal transfer protein [Staphylococcus warneri]PTI24084.1 conjugal transfer protein [Staphylococcus warneri]PTI61382.1 conjugal transfer protein [Staphylococcus warneri]RIM32922.1 conjugal transfer protein [Staphylococcus caprae]RIN00436.1 conjugal transfer protein [Staphylococcus warneri]
MDKKAYNLKRTFEQPIVFYEFTDNFRINKGVRIDWVATFAIIELILTLLFVWLLRPIVTAIPGIVVIYFTAMPYYLTKYIVKLKQDGKKLMFFLFDFLVYAFNIQLRNTKYSFDEEVQYHDKEIKFK